MQMGALSPPKILHLVRHAQGNHNIAGEKNHDNLLNPDFFDSPLSSLGLHQANDLRNHVRASGLLNRIELVVTSPLTRAMKTAVEVFGNHTSDSEIKSPPILAYELCRERFGVHPCDKRRSISETRPLFPQVDFSLIESDEDNLWKEDVQETREDVAARGFEFMDWLDTRPEREIAIVTHNRFLEYTLDALTQHCDPNVKMEISKPFGNCELRSVVMVDKRRLQLNEENTAVCPLQNSDMKWVSSTDAAI